MIGDRRLLQRLPGGGFAYVLMDDAVRIEARHLRRDGGQLHGEVDVQADWAGASRHNGSLSSAWMNLSSQPTRKQLANYCAQRAKTKPEDFDWFGTIDAGCIEIIAADRRGDDVIILDDAPDVVDRDVDVCGLRVPADAASMVIAHGDSLKSLVALLVLGTLAQRDIPVLYCDWEWSAARHKARKRRLFGADRLDGLHYLRCRAPLVVEADRIRRYCDEHRIAFLAIDSVGLACDGKLGDDDVAIRFHRALGSLPPALCAAHVPKSAAGPDATADPVGPFGSVFFSNLCRSSWLIKKQPGATDDLVTIGLFPQKQNDGDRLKPVGLEFRFTADRIDVDPVDLATVAGLADKLPLSGRMLGLLKAGPSTIATIATTLEAKPDTVEKTLKRHEGKLFTRVDGVNGVYRWGVLERRSA
jgi:hypothetical protein